MPRSMITAGALALGVLVAGTSGAQPEHPGGAMRQACAADIQKLCPDAKPGPGGGMRECVRDHFDALSDGCKAAIAEMRARRQNSGPALDSGPPPNGGGPPPDSGAPPSGAPGPQN